MNIYKWRKNFSSTVSNSTTFMKAKLAFKTKETHWLDTNESAVILVSIHSNFHEGLAGELKMQALCHVIRSHVKGKVTLLLAEKAHLNVMELKYNSKREAFKQCVQDAKRLSDRFKKYFADCEVAFWHDYIDEMPYYTVCYHQVEKLYQEDLLFKEYLISDVEKTYTKERAVEFPDRALFIEKTVQDILGQCTCILVLSHKGYRFQFYPGLSYKAIEYINNKLLSKEQKLSLIHVFLTIEQKNITIFKQEI